MFGGVFLCFETGMLCWGLCLVESGFGWFECTIQEYCILVECSYGLNTGRLFFGGVYLWFEYRKIIFGGVFFWFEYKKVVCLVELWRILMVSLQESCVFGRSIEYCYGLNTRRLSVVWSILIV